MSPTIRSLRWRAVDLALTEPFAIAGGAQTRAANVFVVAELSDGTRGWGEAAPFPAFDGQTQRGTLAALRRAAPHLRGLPAAAFERWHLALARAMPKHSCARAALEMAVLDAYARSRRLPLYALFGGAETRLASDVTIPVVSAERAAVAAARLRRAGVKTLKIKIGSGLAADTARVGAALRTFPRARLILDANAGYGPDRSLELLARLRRRRIHVDLFEQPARPGDLTGMARVARRVRVAADESAASPADVWRLARAGAAHVVNVKLMKSGVIGAWRLAQTARAAGLGLMIGGLIETRLAMTCAAHLAAGLGGFSFIDLDTPLFLAADPLRGPPLAANAVYDLADAGPGIGPRPKRAMFAVLHRP